MKESSLKYLHPKGCEPCTSDEGSRGTLEIVRGRKNRWGN